MSPLGLEIYDRLSLLDGVTLLRDDSSRDVGEAVTCLYGGAQYRIMIEHGPANSKIPDAREPQKEDW